MGQEQPGTSQPDDQGSARFHFKKILASNTGQCMEEGLGVNLNLGSGKIKWPNWLAVDIERGDIKCDLRSLDLPNDYADQAAAIHVLEHFYQWEVIALLKEWRRVLKPGGKLILELPCMDKVISYIHNCITQNLPISPSFSWFVFWGDPKYKDPYMVHRWGYTKAMLEEALTLAAFREVTFMEPRYHFPQRDMRVECFK